MQAERLARAVAEFPFMRFTPIPNRPGWHWCERTDNKEARYQVHEHAGCHCPDYQTRCHQEYVKCKHQQALPLYLQASRPEPIRRAA